jgi:hypothetical protein
LLRSEDGKTYVGLLGVSNEEITAALEIKRQKDHSKAESEIITRHIQGKIKDGPQKPADRATDHTAIALATPTLQRESKEFSPAQRA